jgi:hypothetical protein
LDALGHVVCGVLVEILRVFCRVGLGLNGIGNVSVGIRPGFGSEILGTDFRRGPFGGYWGV